MKMLRPLRSADGGGDEPKHSFSTSSAPTLSSQENDSNSDEQPFDKTLKIAGSFIEFMQIWWEDFYKAIIHGLSVHCNAQNTIYFVKYVSVLIVTLITSSLYAVKYLGFFTLHFMAQSRELIRVMTPILMQLIDLLNKVIGGFFILLAMIWRDCVGSRSPTKVPPNNYQSIMPPSAATMRQNERRYRFYSK